MAGSPARPVRDAGDYCVTERSSIRADCSYRGWLKARACGNARLRGRRVRVATLGRGIPRVGRYRTRMRHERHEQLAGLLHHHLVRRMLEPNELLRGRLHTLEPLIGNLGAHRAIMTAGQDDERAIELLYMREIDAQHRAQQKVL